MYFIFYQEYDDMKYFYSDDIKKINSFMKKNNIPKEEVVLIKGELISGLDNKHWETK